MPAWLSSAIQKEKLHYMIIFCKEHKLVLNFLVVEIIDDFINFCLIFIKLAKINLSFRTLPTCLVFS